jgi:PLP dependent protein
MKYLPSGIPNLHTVQTLSSEKAATALNKALASLISQSPRTSPLNVLIQVNTSGEDAKSGLPPLSSASIASSDLAKLAKHVILNCQHLHFQGLMTIGSLELSLNATETEKNADFERLKETRDLLEGWLRSEPQLQAAVTEGKSKWGSEEHSGRLVMSMGMSSDFEAALKAGSDIVRVGTGIFGQRKMKEEVKAEKAHVAA